ncbi:MAG TPA: family 16 glycosylhydrolase, partial [Candidatus Sulfotelmatobacter sp.]|nr:family 16 glycosylhydrolase [Candidatus Sulfotelmatobacter sp.]
MDTARAVSCNGSNLVLTTFTTNGIHYTAILDTQDRFVFKYGYVEASINFDDSPGMWSAYWMESPTMGSYIGEPAYAGIEIDVCEHRKVDASGNNIDGQVVANLHWDGYGASHKSTGSGNIGSGLGTGFHTYAVNWTD